jgi:hypothetical protein
VSEQQGMTPAERQRARKIATVALHLAMKGDLEEAANYVKRLKGDDGLLLAIQARVDTFIARFDLRAKGDRRPPVRMMWLNVESGQVETADETSPKMRWAGRLIAARIADDPDTYYALLKAPAGGSELGDHIMALLHSVAISLRDADRVQAVVAEVARG